MKAAVLGSPIAHSLSPVLHNAGYAALGLSGWSYGRFEVLTAELPAFVAGLGPDWRGLSLTMPLKEACLDVAATVSARARLVGAGNTLVRTPAGWHAENTDVAGLVAALLPHWQPGWRQAALLGAGATARSALAALSELGVTQVACYARNPDRAAAFGDWAAATFPAVQVASADLAAWAGGGAPVVLSTLPAGAADRFALPSHRPQLLFDAVYAGWPTPLARAGAAAGVTVVGGLDLLVHQAARQFELFTDRPAPVAAMFAAGRAALGGPA